MSVVAPFHSAKPNTNNVHHNNSECTEGSSIEPQYLRSGNGGRPLCALCAQLARK